MKLLIIPISKLVILVGAIYSLFQTDQYKRIIFNKDNAKLSIKDNLLLIALFSLIGLLGFLIQPQTRNLFLGFEDMGFLLAGLLGGPLIGIFVGIVVSLYKITLINQNAILVIVDVLVLSGVAGFLRINFDFEEEFDYKAVIIKSLVPVSLLYLLLNLNVIYRFTISTPKIATFKLFLNLIGVYLTIFSINKLKQYEQERKLKDKAMDNLNKSFKKLNGLYEMVNEVDTSATLHATLNSIINVTCKALQVDAGGIMLLDDDKSMLTCDAVKNLNKKHIPGKIEVKGLWASIIENQKVIIKNDISFDKESNFINNNNYTNLLAAPLVEDDNIYGILFVAENIKFNNEDLKTLKALATQASFVIKQNQLFNKMQRNVAELSTLQRVSKTINSTLNLEQVLDLTNDVIVGTMGVSSCAVLLIDEESQELDLAASRGVLGEKSEIKNVINNSDCILINELFEMQKPLVYNTVPEEIKENLGMSQLKSAITVPLKSRGNMIGAIIAINTLMAHSFKEEDKRFLTTLANQISIAIDNARIYNRMEEMASRDGLTKLYNHSYFQEALAEEINRAERYNLDLSLLLLDIDNFKSFNDTYGHPVGDKVLKKLAETLQITTRDIDIIARYGGEEFAIILPETKPEGAKRVGKRINKAVREMIIKEGDLELNVTVSIGVATYNNELSQKELINNADQALYQAKDEGKDRTCVA
ncbi:MULTISPECIES: sensor domain-containing diguanylate cyclase [unclassified Candidatus Frackibacter]|uniref:sensor domain-containing diguanylate cyclase n=1 Tax=unclassified Candidatus Frackibacter TaxID=2648818 RepID=UPI0007979A9C|nr:MULTISPECIES: diguanylate cyclase [unclassified Candidatus Frackibacter]KXS40395.1 MAG: GAF sensor-containing diguanylate cyclase [Candidatus Frackibacter sp. T328-2]SDC37674.1 diguanylate cyclase (GGDEF) domain-containing protein [Candidatus Frackibacter sp. WG11]SEM62491.1 diguanylate cyclase (GGDEF) domain-containing protein [Candidatus Frackibacter sp. WG12]SFL65347.1 diguanylate cyclase (GGDEF) domain-containing protein [Candidatus Frackibacter sp. WG13]